MSQPDTLSAHDREAEAAAIGAALLDRVAALELVALPSEAFYVQQHRVIRDAIATVLTRCQAVDPVSVIAELNSTGKLAAAGGATGVSHLIDALPDVANADTYRGIVRDRHLRRDLARIGSDLIRGSGPSSELADVAFAGLLSATSDTSIANVATIGEAAAAVTEEALLLAGGERDQVTIQTGLERLDRRLFIRSGNVVVLAGATSTGKSSLAVQIGLNVARSGRTVAMFSLEMSRNEIAQRVLASVAGVPVERIAAGQLSQIDREQLVAAKAGVTTLPMVVDDTAGLTPRELQLRARRVQVERGLGLVVVDYLQLLKPSTRGRSRTEEVGELSRDVKITAKSLEVPVLVLSQLSRRHLDERREPELRDLRESGSIENDADAVLMLYRPDLSHSATFALLRKQRQGPLARVPLIFNGPTTSFSTAKGRTDD
jgi:replicative DNA helicase